MIRIRAGPRMTTNSDGKMHPTSGNSILIGALRGLFLGALAALDPELLRLDLEHLRDRHAELLGLDDRADEVGERLDLGARDDVAQRLAPRLADADLGERPPELVDEWALHLLDELAQRGVEAEAGADGDRQQVEGVRDLQDDALLALLDAAAEPELRPDVADAGADERRGAGPG